MKKVALVFALAVFVPSLVLAWLAVRSLNDQQFVLERQQSLLYQGVADSLAKDIDNYLGQQQRDFGAQVDKLIEKQKPAQLAIRFDDAIREVWPLADVGFVVSLPARKLLCPDPTGRPEAITFCQDNNKFLVNSESAEVYWNAAKGGGNAYQNDNRNRDNNGRQSSSLANNSILGFNEQSRQTLQQAVPNSGFVANQAVELNQAPSQQAVQQQAVPEGPNGGQNAGQNPYGNYKNPQMKRSVIPQSQVAGQNGVVITKNQAEDFDQYSKIAVSEAEFRQLVGDEYQGTMARFLQNKLKVMIWYRPHENPDLVFGAQLKLPQLVNGLGDLVKELDPTYAQDICVAVLNDTAKPVAQSIPNFNPDSWKRPYVATEIGEALPHWETAVYLLNPTKVTQTAATLKLTLGLLIAVLVTAIGIGSWLIVTDLNRQLALARQKTDFVSNVSHELKTPLTSIRMFSELLAEGRVKDTAKQQSYLNIITAEAARLTRLINNVLDFSRMERGEKKYNFQKCDLVEVVREVADNFKPHLESGPFNFICQLPDAPLMVQGDRDALAQVIVNLLSNAEKYASERKEISVEVRPQNHPLPYAEVRILDRGLGVPKGCEEKIFEQFFRAHDSLSSGIQGSGLGLTLARQIARAHGGEITFERREGGGSCFNFRLPLAANIA